MKQILQYVRFCGVLEFIGIYQMDIIVKIMIYYFYRISSLNLYVWLKETAIYFFFIP
jgi:hypothetical protein